MSVGVSFSLIGQIVVRDSLSLVERDDLRPLDGVVQYSTSTRDFKVTDYSRRVRGNYYWSLPSQFTGNRVRGVS